MGSKKTSKADDDDLSRSKLDASKVESIGEKGEDGEGEEVEKKE